MAVTRDFRRRALGVLFLLASLGMLVAGETLLRERLRERPMAFLLYWMGCFGLVGLTFLIALVDLVVVRRRVRAEQRELVESTLRQIEQTQAAAGKSPQNSGDQK